MLRSIEQIPVTKPGEIMESILKDEDKHIDEIEEVQDQISQMGIQIFLSVQTK